MQGQQRNPGHFEVYEKPPFPIPGSVIGRDGRYFCLGPLGRGTFCSIHKCVDLSYSHSLIPSQNEKMDMKSKTVAKPKLRLVAAKVELSNFSNSGVLDGEASILSYLSNGLEESCVPIFVEYIKDFDSNGTTDKNTHTNGLSSTNNYDTTSGGGMGAIIMEYLAGEDMHTLRDQHCLAVAARSSTIVIPAQDPQVSQSSQIPTKSFQPVQSSGRRLLVSDAVHLCAEVMLPLIRKLHNMGIVHRDIKPSNCVRARASNSFRLIDFGLSKSFVFSEDSSLADRTKPWNHQYWMGPHTLQKQKQQNHRNSQGAITDKSDTGELVGSPNGYIRKERPTADFRGTSMYASLRVHQSNDFARRDDIWSLMYVFCDFVSGGLPWMTFAAARDRKMCLVLKEWVHGERRSWDKDENDTEEENNASPSNSHSDHVDELLKGADYYINKFKRDNLPNKAKTDCESTPAPSDDMMTLPLSQDPIKVECLRTIFRHLCKLNFADEPDYDLVYSNLKRFGESCEESRSVPDEAIPCILWGKSVSVDESERLIARDGYTTDTESLARVDPAADVDDIDPLEEVIKNDAQREISNSIFCDGENGKNVIKYSAEVEDLNRLPLALQLRLAQAEYNACNPSSIPIHLALRDWIGLARSLLNEPWDIAKYERREYRSMDISFRREFYARLLDKCLHVAKPFKSFLSADAFFFTDELQGKEVLVKELQGCKRRKISKDLLEFSKIYHWVKHVMEQECSKNIAPPLALSF